MEGDGGGARPLHAAARQTFRTKLTCTASHDTAPLLDGQLTWNGSKYGAYFVVHGAGGFADGHFGDKLSYVSAKGAKLSGGWGWGCSHNEGIALHAETTGAFTSLCFDDWRSGLFVSTGIGAPDNAPVVQREQCWAGYCGGTFAGRTGDLVKSSTGRYATAFASRGAASAEEEPGRRERPGLDGEAEDQHPPGGRRLPEEPQLPRGQGDLPDQRAGHGTRQRPRRPVRQGPAARLLGVPEERQVRERHLHRHVHGHAPAADRLERQVSKTPDKVVQARITGDIAVLKDGTLTWAYAPVTPSYATPLNGASPTTTTLKIARLKP